MLTNKIFKILVADLAVAKLYNQEFNDACRKSSESR
jgi:hypothetical protein